MPAAASHMHTPNPAFKCVAGIFAALCIATTAHAQDRASLCDGLGSASIVRDGAEYVVTVVNPFCPSNGWPDGLTVVVLEIDGLRIPVQLRSEQGRTPDTFVVIAPAGWLSDPASLTLEEQAHGVIRLRPMGLS
jgi:hypothetical protein